MKTIISVWEKYKKSINNKYVTELLRWTQVNKHNNIITLY
jgi:hypothetical protein